MIIRNLTEQDIPAIIRMGGRMHEESRYAVLDFDPQKVADRCYQVLSCPETMIGLVAEDKGRVIGMMGGYLAPYDYGHELTASDILVYVDPAHRGSGCFYRMVKAYVGWAKDKGARLIFLNQTSGVAPQLTSALYERLGFRLVGSNHCLEVC